MWKYSKTYKWNLVENALFLPPSFTRQYVFQCRILLMPKHNRVRILIFKKEAWSNLHRIVLQKEFLTFILMLEFCRHLSCPNIHFSLLLWIKFITHKENKNNTSHKKPGRFVSYSWKLLPRNRSNFEEGETKKVINFFTNFSPERGRKLNSIFIQQDTILRETLCQLPYLKIIFFQKFEFHSTNLWTAPLACSK